MALTVLDAGPLIGVLDAGDPHHAVAVLRLGELLRSGDDLVVPASVYAEVLVEPLRRGEAVAGKVETFLAELGARVEPVTSAIAKSAAALRAAHGSKLRLPDALVVATAQIVAADRVLTTDSRWPRRLPVVIEVLGPRRRRGSQ